MDVDVGCIVEIHGFEIQALRRQLASQEFF
jgi:hypothetical protein